MRRAERNTTILGALFEKPRTILEIIEATGIPRTSVQRGIRELERLGFIKVEPGPNGDISYVLILHPVTVIENHAKKKTPNLSKDYLNALRDRATQVGSKDR